MRINKIYSSPLITFLIFVIMWCPSWSYAKDITVLAFGDSLIAGYGLPETDQFCAQLEIFLKEEGELVSVVNAGVSGDTSMAGFSRLEWSLASNPDAVILELGANDGLRGLDPAVTRMNLKKILQQLKRIGTPVLFAGMLAPPNLGKEYGKEFNAVFSELASEYDVIFYPFFLDGVAGRPRLNQSDGIHPNREGVREIIKRIIPYVRKLLTQVKQN